VALFGIGGLSPASLFAIAGWEDGVRSRGPASPYTMIDGRFATRKPPRSTIQARGFCPATVRRYRIGPDPCAKMVAGISLGAAVHTTLRTGVRSP